MCVVVEARPVGAGEGISAKYFDHTRDSLCGICGQRSMFGVVSDAVPLLGRAVYHGLY